MNTAIRTLVAGLLLPAAVHAAKLNVVATTPDLAAMARDIGGHHVTVTCLGKPSEDPHYIQAKPSAIVALNKADTVILVGMELEVGWLPALINQTRNARIQAGAPGYIDASVGVRPLDVPTEAVTRAMGDVHPYGNPHYLLDPERGKIAARNIAAALARIDPARAGSFAENLDKLLARIDTALADAQALLAPYRGTKVVTYHRSFPYFAERYGLEVVGEIEPKPGIPPSPAHVATLCETARQRGARLILTAPWHERRTPELLAQQTGAKVVELPVQVGGEVADYSALCIVMARKIAAALK